MDPVEVPTVVTAISDPEFEGLVSRALFSQGWNVIARVMDFPELLSALSANSGKKLLLIFSTDLPGSSPAEIEKLAATGISLFGFADQNGNDRGFSKIFPRPTSPENLTLIILENIRSSGIRTPLIHAATKLRAKVVAVGGIGHATANTTIAINLAQESALLNIKTLLIEANFQAPAISSLLDQRKLSSEPSWRDFSENLSIMELTQETITEFEQRITAAGEFFDQIVIDLGSIAFLSSELSDRRWSSVVKIWAVRSADHFVLTTTSTFLAQKRCDEFMQSFTKISTSAEIHLVNTRSANKRGPELNSSRKLPLRSAVLWTFPFDLRACHLAIEERTTLQQAAERGALRKEIAKMAQALSAISTK
jgi:hypothetical protein